MKKHGILGLFIFFTITLNAMPNSNSWQQHDIFQTNYFIKNNGQFDFLNSGTKKIIYGIQHQGDEFYFTATGFYMKVSEIINSNTENKINTFQYDEEREEYESKHLKKKTAWVELKWLHTNPNVEILEEEKSAHYFSYGDAKFNAYGFKTLTYKNIYPKIDLQYQIHPKGGITYKLLLHPGAKLSDIQFSYIGNELNTTLTPHAILMEHPIKSLFEKDLHAFYFNATNDTIPIQYQLLQHVFSFKMPNDIDTTQTIIIDPWINAVNTLSGNNNSANCGYDIDYDVHGNLYVFGGGGNIGITSSSLPKVAMYDMAGNLKWVFVGIVPSIGWDSSPGAMDSTMLFARAGNMVVDQLEATCYVSQGLNVKQGASVIRLNVQGNFDNFNSVNNLYFQEIWDLKLNCHTGELLGVGGGTTSNINLGVIDTSSGIAVGKNITGIQHGSQDAVNATIGPLGEVYILFVNVGVQDIYKLNTNNSGYVWKTSSGSTHFSEQDNKAYTNNASFSNGYNCLSANDRYLFFYDGEYLKCFDVHTGIQKGNASFIAGNAISKGGIYANICDEIFIGGANGDVKKLKFDGTQFTYLQTYTIPGFAGKNIHDICYSKVNDELYICGDGVVASLDSVSTCPNIATGNLELHQLSLCPNIIKVIIKNPDLNTAYTFIWQKENDTVLQSNTFAPGIFADSLTGVILGKTYKVTVLQTTPCDIFSNVIYVRLCCSGQGGNYIFCDNEPYMAQSGVVYSQQGIYLDTFKNVFGLDSVVEFSLNFLPTTSAVIYDTICQGQYYTLPSGKVVSTAGTYIDSFKSIFFCDSIIITYLHLLEIPVVNLGPDIVMCLGEVRLLNTKLTTGYFIWNDMSTNNYLQVSDEGNYYVQVSTPPCPIASDTITITTVDCNCKRYIPNAFSPNMDSRNDVFKPHIECSEPLAEYYFAVFNRWGQLLYQTKSNTDAWDGKYNNVVQDIGTYFYIVKYTNPFTNIKIELKGDVTLVK